MRNQAKCDAVFAAMVLPAILGSLVYFGYYAIWGSRGALALQDTQRNSSPEEELAQLHGPACRTQHRIDS